MRRDFIVYNDIHVGALYEMSMELERGAIYNGDIFDISGALRKELPLIKKRQQDLENFAGDRYNHGNHECSKRSLIDYHIDQNVLFMHGHVQMWAMAKNIKWANKRHGSGKWKRRASMWFNKARLVKPVTLKMETLDRCWELAKAKGCDVVILGHSHPTRVVDETYTRLGKTVRVMILPRGRNQITV